ncbi:hypothetical protein CS176_2004 [Corynebacterium glutamicum]|uniref:hypothetical protein n=1 Tax=Corynebacterium glutamicum TaxID=1718 RepID=UPI00097B44E6|nr:hypothetical protein [Corynebacterium glutamicum]GAV97774.1 hypothetical protein CS176_2004 [Corynebacterium glutamicum]
MSAPSSQAYEVSRLPELRDFLGFNVVAKRFYSLGSCGNSIPAQRIHTHSSFGGMSIQGFSAGDYFACFEPRIDAWVDIRGPRKPEWLAENIDNPLRHWVDNPHIPVSAAKKAGNIYKETLRTIRASTKTPDQAPLKETCAASSQASTSSLQRRISLMQGSAKISLLRWKNYAKQQKLAQRKFSRRS